MNTPIPFTSHRFLVDESEGSVRVDRFLVAHLRPPSRNDLVKRIRNLRIQGKAARTSQVIHPGETVELDVEAKVEVEKLPIPELPILFEDESMIAVFKPAGVVVHPASSRRGGTVADWLAPRLLEPAENFPEPIRAGIVHRLDGATSGVLLLAKTLEAQVALMKAFAERRVLKVYWALVKGVMHQVEGAMDEPIGPDPNRPLRMAAGVADGREALTLYRRLHRFEKTTLVEARPQTGRTHQIRVHFLKRGHPVVGDKVYDRGCGPEDVLMLSARLVAFPHPLTGEETVVVAPLSPAVEGRLRKEGWTGQGEKELAEVRLPEEEPEVAFEEEWEGEDALEVEETEET